MSGICCWMISKILDNSLQFKRCLKIVLFLIYLCTQRSSGIAIVLQCICILPQQNHNYSKTLHYYNRYRLNVSIENDRKFTKNFLDWTGGFLCTPSVWCCPQLSNCHRLWQSRVYCSGCGRSRWKLTPMLPSKAQLSCQHLLLWHQTPPYVDGHICRMNTSLQQRANSITRTQQTHKCLSHL